MTADCADIADDKGQGKFPLPELFLSVFIRVIRGLSSCFTAVGFVVSVAALLRTKQTVDFREGVFRDSQQIVDEVSEVVVGVDIVSMHRHGRGGVAGTDDIQAVDVVFHIAGDLGRINAGRFAILDLLARFEGLSCTHERYFRLSVSCWRMNVGLVIAAGQFFTERFFSREDG